METLKVKKRAGMTGLETAIIVIAFVIVASAFAFAVLNMGFLSSQKSSQVIQTGLEESSSAMEPDGGVIAYADGSGTSANVTKIEAYVKLSAGKNPVDISNDTLIIAYTDPYVHVENVYTNFNDEDAVSSSTGSIIEIKGDGDNALEYGEKFKVVINLQEIYNSSTITLPNGTSTSDAYGGDVPLQPNDSVRFELKPPVGAVLTFEKRLPATFDEVMILD